MVHILKEKKQGFLNIKFKHRSRNPTVKQVGSFKMFFLPPPPLPAAVRPGAIRLHCMGIDVTCLVH